MIERGELDGELASLEAQHAKAEAAIRAVDAQAAALAAAKAEQMDMIKAIGGAARMIRHLIDRSSGKVIAARAAADAATGAA